MQPTIHQLVYPELDTAEIQWPLRFNQLVDVQGRPVQLPLRTTKQIVYRVYRISTKNTRHEQVVEYYLEQLFPSELRAFLG